MQQSDFTSSKVFSLSLALNLAGEESGQISFLTEAGDIAFFLDLRLRAQEAVLNSCVAGKWGGQVSVALLEPALMKKPFTLNLRFSYRMVEVSLPGQARLSFTGPFGAELIRRWASTCEVGSVVIKTDLACPSLAAGPFAGLQLNAPAPVSGLTAVAIDCGEWDLHHLRETCEEIIEIDTTTFGGSTEVAAHAVELTKRLNRVVSESIRNVVIVSKGCDDSKDLRALVMDLDLRYRRDPFLLALGSSYAIGSAWIMAVPGGVATPFVATYDAISPNVTVAQGATLLHADVALKTLPGGLRNLRADQSGDGSTILQAVSPRFAIVRTDAAESDAVRVESGAASEPFSYALCRKPHFRIGVEGQTVVVPDMPRYRQRHRLVIDVARHLFDTTDLDAVLFLSDGNALPPSLPSYAFARCEVAHLELATGKFATFVTRCPDLEKLVSRLLGTGTVPELEVGAVFWDASKVERSPSLAIDALAKALNAAASLPAEPQPTSPDDAALPGIILGAIGRALESSPAAAASVDWGQLGVQLVAPEVAKRDWKWVNFLLLGLGHRVGVQERTGLLNQLADIQGISRTFLFKSAGTDSSWEHEWDDATYWFERLRQQDDGAVIGAIELARTRLWSGKAGEALSLLDEVLQHAEICKFDLAAAQDLKFTVLDYLGEHDKALELFMPQVVDVQLPAQKLARGAACALSAGRTEVAGELLARLRRTGKEAPNRLYLEAVLAQKLGRYEESERRIEEFVTTQAEYSPLSGAPTSFRRLDKKELAIADGSVTCIIVCRNEGLRLPWLLDYYRGLGVGKFIVIDNGSTDGSVEFLLDRDDTHIFQTSDSYAASRYGVKWHNEIADEYLRDQWVLVADADEALVYPQSDSVSLPELCRYLDQQGYEGLRTFMLDMYPAEPLAELNYVAGQSLIEACPWFDEGPYVHYRTMRAPYWSVTGGVRERFFWHRSHGFKAPPPAIQKIPLVKWRKGMRYLSSTHEVSPLEVADISGVILHFKFLQDFHRRALIEVRRKEHYNGASEYAAYLKAMDADPKISLKYSGSHRYGNWRDLDAMGLIRRTESFDRHCGASKGKVYA